MAQPNEVFISHSSKNARFTRKLARTLTENGVPVWYSARDIQGAQQWHDEIGAALARCDWFILVLSPDSVGSKWVKHEFLYSLRSDRYEGRIVPLMLKACDASALSWVIDGLQHVDFTGDYAEGCKNLLRVWGPGVGP